MIAASLIKIFRSIIYLYQNAWQFDANYIDTTLNEITEGIKTIFYLRQAETQRGTITSPSNAVLRFIDRRLNHGIHMIRRQEAAAVERLRSLQEIRRRRNETRLKEKVVALNKKEVSEYCDDTCPICMEKHTKVDSLKTNCGHIFGKECFKTWYQRSNNCPTCRNKDTNVTTYRPRASRKAATQTLTHPPSHEVIEL
jgi:hypothetical protein